MIITPYKIRVLVPPQDNLLAALFASKLKLRDGDILAISSKVVSIHEGRSVPLSTTNKETLIQREADFYFETNRSRYQRRFFTIARGMLVGAAGIDESNSNGHYILYPEHPFESAKRLRRQCMRHYGLKRLGFIITDSVSIPLRRGAIGSALAWDGLDPLRDYRGTTDIFGRTFQMETANLIDALAASAVFSMGEGKEQMPMVLIRGAKNIIFKNRSPGKDQLVVTPKEDLFAPLLFTGRVWRRGRHSRIKK